MEITEIDGRIHMVKISVDKSSTSEAAIAAALQSQINTQIQLMKLFEVLAPLMAGPGMR